VIVLDNGALIALERNDRKMWARLKAAATAGVPVVVPAAAFAQAWRGGSQRQAHLARALDHLEFPSLDEPVARAAGVLCGMTGTSDVVDASVALAAAHPDVTAVCTSDPTDLTRLLEALRSDTLILRC
jgi:hypothetical protein